MKPGWKIPEFPFKCSNVALSDFYLLTFSSFAFSHQESSSMVPRIQQQPLSIFASHFTKVPPVKRKHTHNTQMRAAASVIRPLMEWSRSRCSNVIRSGSEALLFSLDGVSRGHIIAGDVAFPPRVDGASLPPVSFPTRITQETWHKFTYTTGYDW